MTYIPILVGRFVAGTYLPVGCEVGAEVGCVLAYIYAQNVVSHAHMLAQLIYQVSLRDYTCVVIVVRLVC